MSGRPKVSLADRFMAKVMKTDTCWLWIGCRNADGYGRITTVDRRVANAHRVSYELFVGPIPSGLLIRHRCDNPQCVNPNHLEIGTVADNSNDAKLRGRTRKGESRIDSKLTDEMVAELRRLYEPGSRKCGCNALAKRFGVGLSTVYWAVRGDTWSHVSGNRETRIESKNGVYLYQPNKKYPPKWVAKIKRSGRLVSLGTFETPDLAKEFRQLALDMLSESMGITEKAA